MRFLPLSIVFVLFIFASPPAYAACTDPAATPGEIIYNNNLGVFQGCTQRGWTAFHLTNAISCPNPGDVCKDGTIYAGPSPDGGSRMYATSTDGAGGTNYKWNNGSAGPFRDTPMVSCETNESSCSTGSANTTILAGIVSGMDAPYQAAAYCDGLSAHGRTDWYLPSRDELRLLYDLHDAGKGGFSDEPYWSSSEIGDEAAWYIDFQYGLDWNTYKYASSRVRCVRK